MGKPDPPTPPDPKVTAEAQTASNVDTAVSNARLAAVNQNSPYGNVNYSVNGYQSIGGHDVPQYTQNISLSPEQQGLYNSTTNIEQQALNTGQQAVGNVQNTISQPFNLNGLPPLQTGASAPNLASSYGSYAPQFGAANAGNVQTGLGSAGNIQTGIGNTGNIQSGLGDAGPVSNQIAPAGDVQSSVAGGGPIASQIAPAGNVQSGLNTGGLSAMPTPADFQQQSNQVENAYLGRYHEDSANQREAAISRLNAEGLQEGSKAYGDQMNLLNRQDNDATNQAILAGQQMQSQLFNQSMQSRQQGFGEAQTAGQFANAAQGQQFGQNASQLAAQNSAQAQQFGQNTTAGQFANTAQQQQFGQNASQQAAQNAAQQQLFNQFLNSGQFGNTAQQQQYNQALSNGQFGNTAQQQQFGQLLSGGQFANTAQQQQFGQNQDALSAYNQAAAQGTAQNQAGAGFYNTAQQQGFQNQTANAQLGNQARQQAINEQQLQRNQPLNELASLLGMSQIQTPTGAPNFGVQVAPTDVLGAYGQQQAGQMNNYNQQMGANNALWGALSNVAGAAGGAAIKSDARAKDILAKLGKTDGGHQLYLYRYKGTTQNLVGVIAQEVAKIAPEAVIANDNGVLFVDWSKVA